MHPFGNSGGPAGRVDCHDFSPGILGIEHAPPSPLPRLVVRGILLLLAFMLAWATWGQLDIVAVAEGKLVPASYLKIVQPAEAGIVREILVEDGMPVSAGQLLLRMDANLVQADGKALQHELQHKQLQLRRIDAELSGIRLRREPSESAELFRHVEAEFLANQRALKDALAGEQAELEKARLELAATQQVLHKLARTLPSYQAQEQAYVRLGQVGFAGNLMVLDKQRERIEAEQDLRAQEYTVRSLLAEIARSEHRQAQIVSGYRQKLQAEKVAAFAELQNLEQQWAKQQHRSRLLELRAPQAGIVKDLATHTPGTVVSPGAVLMSLVPNDEVLRAEIWVRNEDAGFVHQGQQVRIKLAAYPFQKYGMASGDVMQVGADANATPEDRAADSSSSLARLPYRTLVSLQSQALESDGRRLQLSPGMQLTAEIRLGRQSVLEYLLSPVRKAFHEAGRER